jgi:hypothetical protein
LGDILDVFRLSKTPWRRPPGKNAGVANIGDEL